MASQYRSEYGTERLNTYLLMLVITDEVWDHVYLTAQGALSLGVWSLEAKGQLREHKAVFHFLST